jgi:hypothetical protein
VSRCSRRVLRLEKAIDQLLLAWDNSEMSNLVEALDKLRKLMEQI